MARPIPIIAAVTDVTTLPGSMVLDGSASLDSVGNPANIATWQWVLVEKPPGSAATLIDATTSIATLTSIDIVGNYVVFLVIEDNLGRESFGTPYPRQHLPPEDLVTYDVALYAYESPVPGAFVVVKAPYNNVAARLNQPIYKTGRKEYGWLENAWNQTDTIEDLRTEMLELYDRPNATVMADAVLPQTPGGGVGIDGLTIRDTGSLITLDGAHATIRSLDNFSVAANKNLQLEVGTGSLRTNTVQSTSGGDITSLSGMVIPEVTTPQITALASLDIDAVTTIVLDAGSHVSVTAANTATLTSAGNLVVHSTAADVRLRGGDDVRATADTGDIVLTATAADISLSAGGTTTLASVGTITIDSTGGNVSVSAITGYANFGAAGNVVIESTAADVSVIAEEALTLRANEDDLLVEAPNGRIDITCAQVIELGPAQWTESTKPVFAPGLDLSETRIYTTPAPTGSPITLASCAFTRHSAGSAVDVVATFNYTVVGGAHENDLAFIVSSTSLPPVTLPLVEVGVGVKSVGRVSARLQLAIPTQYILHAAVSILEKIGAGATTAVSELYLPLGFDATETLYVSLLLTPRSGNTWGAGSSLAGLLRATLVTTHAEAVL